MKTLLLLSAAISCVCLAPPSIELDSCKVEGVWSQLYTEVAQFKSIPFAHAAIGERRWAEPEGISTYDGKVCDGGRINATYNHNRCYQLQFGSSTKVWPEMSEDCLNLDIYAPKFATQEKLKVMVYFHGGSSVSGGSFQFDFTRFSQEQNVVVVVPNYRLALIGFMSFTDLSAISTTKTSGNYGLMDCKRSLEWVKQHIHHFGGLSDDVTVFGQSTGGTVVLSMLASPSTAGLVKRGISLSGSPNISMLPEEAERQGERFVAQFGCASSSPADVVACMRGVPAENITAAYPSSWGDADGNNFGLPGPSKAGFNEAGLMIVDGHLVTHTLQDALSKGVNPFPIMLGNTQFETDFKPNVDVRNLTTRGELAGYLNANFAEWGETFGENIWHSHYESEYTLGNAPLVYDAIGADATGFCGSWQTARIAADSTAFTSPVYVFSMQQFPSHPFHPREGADCNYSFHSIDLFAATYTWDSFSYWGALPYQPGETDNAYGKAVRDQWAAFMDRDRPLPSWKMFSGETGYGVALIGNGTHKATLSNRTLTVEGYKMPICEMYAENGITRSFWWSN